MTVLRKATVKSYDAASHEATVQIAGSLAVWLDGVRIATDIPAADVIAGRQCTVLFLDPSNQDDAVVLTIQGANPSTPSGATVAASATVVSETAFGQAAAAGTASPYSRGDHTHGSPTDPVTAHVAAADPHTVYGALAQAETWAALQTFSVGIQLAAGQAIKDSAGTPQITVQTATPQVTIEKDLRVKGSGISGGLKMDRGGNDSPDLMFVTTTNTWSWDSANGVMRARVGGSVYFDWNATPRFRVLGAGGSNINVEVASGVATLQLLSGGINKAASLRFSRSQKGAFSGMDWLTGNNPAEGWSFQMPPSALDHGPFQLVDRAISGDPSIFYCQPLTQRIGIGDHIWSTTGDPAGTLHLAARDTDDVALVLQTPAAGTVDLLQARPNDVLRSRVNKDGRLVNYAPDSAIAAADLNASELAFYLDEASNTVTVKAKYTDGTIKTGTIPLT